MADGRDSGAQVPDRLPLVLVTGAPGWLGNRLLEVLDAGLPGLPQLLRPNPGRRVRCLVHPVADTAAVTALLPGAEIVRGDLTDPAASRALCRDAGGAVLLHLAAIIHPTRGTREFEEVNVGGTRHLLEAAIDAGVRRFVAVSSTSPFGFNADDDAGVFDGGAPYHPYMGYGRSKHRMERLVQAAHAEGRIETVIARSAWLYGPHQPPRQTRFFTMVRDGRFPVLGRGTQRRSMSYVDNVCQGLLLAATRPEANGQAYWLADERPYSLNEIVDTVRRALEDECGIACARRQMRVPALVGEMARVADGCLQAVGRYSQPLHVLGELTHSIACSIQKTQRDLGYQPTVALYDGMRASIRWCLARGMRL